MLCIVPTVLIVYRHYWLWSVCHVDLKRRQQSGSVLWKFFTLFVVTQSTRVTVCVLSLGFQLSRRSLSEPLQLSVLHSLSLLPNFAVNYIYQILLCCTDATVGQSSNWPLKPKADPGLLGRLNRNYTHLLQGGDSKSHGVMEEASAMSVLCLFWKKPSKYEYNAFIMINFLLSLHIN